MVLSETHISLKFQRYMSKNSSKFQFSTIFFLSVQFEMLWTGGEFPACSSCPWVHRGDACTQGTSTTQQHAQLHITVLSIYLKLSILPGIFCVYKALTVYVQCISKVQYCSYAALLISRDSAANQGEVIFEEKNWTLVFLGQIVIGPHFQNFTL